MPSATKKTKMRRRIRSIKLGKKRKSYIRIHGTTQPMLPLDEATSSTS